MVRLATSSKLPLWKKKLEARNYMYFPGPDMELKQAFTFSAGKDHLETWLNSCSVLFNPHDLNIESGFLISSFIIEGTSVTQTWPKMTSSTWRRKEECKSIQLAEFWRNPDLFPHKFAFNLANREMRPLILPLPPTCVSLGFLLQLPLIRKAKIDRMSKTILWFQVK